MVAVSSAVCADVECYPMPRHWPDLEPLFGPGGAIGGSVVSKAIPVPLTGAARELLTVACKT